jgi:hypothetical protein
MHFSATLGTGAARVQGDFAFDATRRTLTYDVKALGARRRDIAAISIARDSAGRAGPIMRRLAGQGAARSAGALTLGDFERRELLAGRLVLAVFASDASGAVTRTAEALLPREVSDARR